MSLDESLLTDSVWRRARRDTWPTGWWKRVGRRALVAGLAFMATYLFVEEANWNTLAQSTLIGVGAFVLADVVLYPLHALLAPVRQRNELRAWARRELARSARNVGIRAALGHGSGDIRIIDVTNPGTVVVRDITVEMPESQSILPVRWKRGEVVIDELRPGERGTIPFMARKAMGLTMDPIRAEIQGVVGEQEVVSTTVVIDPLRF